MLLVGGRFLQSQSRKSFLLTHIHTCIAVCMVSIFAFRILSVGPSRVIDLCSRHSWREYAWWTCHGRVLYHAKLDLKQKKFNRYFIIYLKNGVLDIGFYGYFSDFDVKNHRVAFFPNLGSLLTNQTSIERLVDHNRME